jgi:hypothetical protein
MSLLRFFFNYLFAFLRSILGFFNYFSSFFHPVFFHCERLFYLQFFSLVFFMRFLLLFSLLLF